MLRSISARLNRQTSFEANPLRDTGSGRYDADHNGGLRNACPSPAMRCGGRVAYLAERLNELGVDKPSDTAASILRQFGSIAAFTCSGESEFRRILGQDDVVKIVLATRDLIEAGLREQLDRTILAPDDPALHRYLVRRIGHLRHEVLLGNARSKRTGRTRNARHPSARPEARTAIDRPSRRGRNPDTLGLRKDFSR